MLQHLQRRWISILEQPISISHRILTLKFFNGKNTKELYPPETLKSDLKDHSRKTGVIICKYRDISPSSGVHLWEGER